MNHFVYVLSTAFFAAVFLVLVAVYGGETARNFAIGAALLGAVSSFTAQNAGIDYRSYLVAIWTAYGTMAAGIAAFALMIIGK